MDRIIATVLITVVFVGLGGFVVTMTKNVFVIMMLLGLIALWLWFFMKIIYFAKPPKKTE